MSAVTSLILAVVVAAVSLIWPSSPTTSLCWLSRSSPIRSASLSAWLTASAFACSAAAVAWRRVEVSSSTSSCLIESKTLRLGSAAAGARRLSFTAWAAAVVTFETSLRIDWRRFVISARVCSSCQYKFPMAIKNASVTPTSTAILRSGFSCMTVAKCRAQAGSSAIR